MSYVSLTFPLFVIIVFLLYFVAPLKWRWIVLLFASYAFYFLADAKSLVFIAITTVCTFFAAQLMGHISTQTKDVLKLNNSVWSGDQRKKFSGKQQRKRRTVMICALLLVFGILGVLKYFSFITYNISSLLGLPENLWRLDILLPIGISFYTFQSTSYVIDVYRDAYNPDRNFAKYALFVSFFPQILQGPIGRYDELAPQLTAPNKFSSNNLKNGLQLVLWGYFKKLVIADRIAVLVAAVYDGGGNFGFFVNSIAVLAYGLQIYCDFSGGIDISRGIAEVMGIKMAQNFKRPYFAQTISEFWRRWHITLGNWTREYVFYPVVLSKGITKLARQLRKRLGKHAAKVLPACIASLICFLIIGIWHGAAWKFVFYGLYYGLLIAFSQLFNPFFNRLSDKLKINRKCFSWRLFGMLRTLFLVSIGRCIVRSEDFAHGINMINSSLTRWDPWSIFDGAPLKLGLNQYDYHVLFFAVLILLVVGILQEKGYEIRKEMEKQNLWFRAVIIIGAVIAIVLFGAYSSGYSALNFIYAGF